jgi:MFS superfamily sulfate permease-like transporter
MHWLFLLLALACLFGAWKLTGWLVALLLVAALGLFVAWVLGWAASQANRGGNDQSRILGPEELRRLREQSEARKAAQAADDGAA